jgi:hypothetical protein
MLDSNKDNLKLEAMKRIIGVNFYFLFEIKFNIMPLTVSKIKSEIFRRWLPRAGKHPTFSQQL